MRTSIGSISFVALCAFYSNSFARATATTATNEAPSSSSTDTTKFFDGYNSDDKYLVLIINRLGLANRLRAVADWYQIAGITNRKLLVSWEPTLDCYAKFTDLFDAGPERLKVLPIPLSIQDVENMAREAHLSYYNLDENMDTKPTFQVPTKVLTKDHHLLVTEYDGITSLAGVTCQQYLNFHSEFLRALQPNKFAEEFVRDFKAKYFADRLMIGVHYRSHDKAQDWAVVPPLTGEFSSQATTFGEGATIQHFVSAMQKIQRKMTYNITIVQSNGEEEETRKEQSNGEETRKKQSNVRFFVASNSNEVKQELVRQFPDSVFISGDYSRSSEEGVQFAFLEWLILSESSLLINTYGSSFAVEAAQRRMRPIIGIWEGLLIHHSSMYLPFCGHLQFAKIDALMNDAKPKKTFSYTEGTIDSRLIEGIAVPLSPCSALVEWGFSSEDLLSTTYT